MGGGAESLGLRQTLLLLLAALVSLVLWSMATALSLVWGSANSLNAAPAASGAVASPPAATPRFVHYPEELFDTDWREQVSLNEQLQLSMLHRACMTYNESVVPWNYGMGRVLPANALIHRSDPNVVARLRQCTGVDVFLPSDLHGHGYCEDAAAYAKYMEGRMLPAWVLNSTFFDAATNRDVTYHELCPSTPMIFFNHYWRGMVDGPGWPTRKPLYLMPNLDMHELEAKHYWRADVVLCKTAICTRYLTQWFEQQGNPNNTKVLYTRHTSTNIATSTLAALPVDTVTPKNFDNVKFIHTTGTSIQKGTAHVFDCWLSRPDLPPVDVYIAPELYHGWFEEKYGERIAKSVNIRLHLDKLGALEFGKVITESAFFMCPSLQEGYGHYINQARASGGVVVTTDVAPMNELITPDSGVLIKAEGYGNEFQFLGGNANHPLALRNVTGYIARFGGDDVCAAVDMVRNVLTPIERKRRADRAQQQYYFDTVFFRQKMQELRANAAQYYNSQTRTAQRYKHLFGDN